MKEGIEKIMQKLENTNWWGKWVGNALQNQTKNK
jgi:hypothetical protein